VEQCGTVKELNAFYQFAISEQSGTMRNNARPPRTTAGLPLRLEADREKAGASDLCEGQKL
jgi:hypothetical protein